MHIRYFSLHLLFTISSLSATTSMKRPPTRYSSPQRTSQIYQKASTGTFYDGQQQQQKQKDKKGLSTKKILFIALPPIALLALILVFKNKLSNPSTTKSNNAQPTTTESSNNTQENVSIPTQEDTNNTDDDDTENNTPSLADTIDKGLENEVKKLCQNPTITITAENLHAAIKKGEIPIIESLLDSSQMSSQAANKVINNETALTLAINNEKASIVQLLTKKDKIDLTKKNGNNEHPLFLAYQKKNLPITQALLDKYGQDPNIECNDYKYLLNKIIQEASPNDTLEKIALEFIKHTKTNINANSYKNDNKSSLFLALEKGNKSIAQTLIKDPRLTKETFNEKHMADRYPSQDIYIVTLAIEKGFIDIIKIIINSPNSSQETINQALQSLIKHNTQGKYDSLIIPLLTHKKINGKMLAYALKYFQENNAQGKYDTFIQQLINNEKIDFSYNKSEILHTMLEKKDFDNLQKIITKSNINLNQKDKDGNYLLNKLIKNTTDETDKEARKKIAKKFIDNPNTELHHYDSGFNLTVTTDIYYAIKNKDYDTALLLAQKKLDPNTVWQYDDILAQALSSILYQREKSEEKNKVITALTEHPNININYQNKKERIVLTKKAMQKKKYDFVKKILKDERINEYSIDEAMVEAIKQKKLDIVQICCTKPLKYINWPSNNYLHLAIKTENLPIVKTLLNYDHEKHKDQHQSRINLEQKVNYGRLGEKSLKKTPLQAAQDIQTKYNDPASGATKEQIDNIAAIIQTIQDAINARNAAT